MSSIFRKWVFWFKANNRHGIHSPFVYQFLDQGVYAPHLRAEPPRNKLLRATLEYFRPARIGLSASLSAKPEFPEALSDRAISKMPPYDLFIFESPSEGVIRFIREGDNWHNGSIVFVGNLRGSAGGYRQWRQICRLPEVRVVLETYRAGLLFFRREQARQHFRIRT